MKKKYVILMVLSFLLPVLAGCSKEDPVKPPVVEDEVNEWIFKTMEENYLWYDEIPKKESLNMDEEPDGFFPLLLTKKDGKTVNGKHQYFSYIEEKKTDTKAVSSTNPTYGFDFVLYTTDRTGLTYYAQVLYVLPGSPAGDAGLKRGDWIVRTNNSDKDNITSANVLQTGGEVIFNLARYANDYNSLVLNGSITVDAARIVENNPLYLDSIYNVGNTKVGYFVYNHFTAGPEGSSSDTYNNQIKDLFASFKKEGVTEFILDLRYNGGGLISTARLLTSYLAPASALSNVFAKLEYYDKKSKNNYTMKFDNSSTVTANNLNLQRLYVLTGAYTASASELVVNALIPYIDRENIVLIGDKTIGKNVGSQTYGDEDDYGWVMHPITTRIYNAEGEADYDDGFDPDYYRDELEFGNPLYSLGDKNELLLKTALDLITNSPLRADTPTPSTGKAKIVYSSLSDKKGQGIIIDITE